MVSQGLSELLTYFVGLPAGSSSLATRACASAPPKCRSGDSAPKVKKKRLGGKRNTSKTDENIGNHWDFYGKLMKSEDFRPVPCKFQAF